MDGTKKSNQAYRSVGEVASELGVETHVLRYWEIKFPKYIAPVKRGGGRRYYRPKDVMGARAIEKLIIQQGLTIKGAIRVLGQKSLEAIIDGAAHSSEVETEDDVQTEETSVESAKATSPSDSEKLLKLLIRLRNIKSRIDATLAGG